MTDHVGILADELGADNILLHIVVPGAAARGREGTLLAAHAGMKARAQPPLWRSRRLPGIAIRPGKPGCLILETIEHSHARLLVLGRPASVRCAIHWRAPSQRGRSRRGGVR